MQRFFSLGGLGEAGRRDQQLPRSFFFDRINPKRRTEIAIRLQPFCFHAHIAKLSKVLITGRDWYVLSHRGCRLQKRYQRGRTASAAASRISEKAILVPLLLARVPLSD